mgnify:FL=1
MWHCHKALPVDLVSDGMSDHLGLLLAKLMKNITKHMMAVSGIFIVLV